MRWLSAFLAILLSIPTGPLFGQEATPSLLNIVVVEGEGAINNIRLRTAREPIVQVEDENRKPVAGAAVAFTLPTRGASGAFSNGSRTLTVMTDSQGRAQAKGLQPNNVKGQLQIRVTASIAGKTASAIITQTNIAGAAAAGGAAGSGISAKLLIAVVAVAGAAAAGGVVAATRNGGSSSSPGGGAREACRPRLLPGPARSVRRGERMMSKGLPIVLALGVLFAGASAAGDVSGPVSGYLFDNSARSIRPVLGIPGASLVGESLELGFEIAQAAVAPGQDFIVAVTGEGGVRLIRPASRTVTAIETLHGAPVRVVLSPGGSAALLVNGETADVLTGLPGNPALGRTLALDGLGRVSEWAIGDDGTAVLAASGDAVRVAGESAEWKMLAQPGEGARVAFAPGLRSAAIATAAGVTLYRDVTGGGETSLFASPEENAPAPGAAAFAADGRILLADGRGVTAVDPADGSRARIACDCGATTLAPMGPVFRLNEMSEAPLWLLDPKRDEPRVLFIPAPRSRQNIASETP